MRHRSLSYDAQTRDKVSFGLYLSQQHNDEPMFTNPIHIDVTFFMAIPKSLKDREPSFYHSTTPSLDSLYKFFLESIKDILIKDERLICSLTVKKVYDREPRTELNITEVELDEKKNTENISVY